MKFLAVLFCILTSLQAAAEPSGLVRKLMNTEATMFDLGMLRLDRELKISKNLKLYFASYEWDTNQIHITRLILGGRHSSEGEEIEASCSEGEELGCIAFIKKKLTNETEGLCILNKGKCLFGVSRHFAHRGFKRDKFYSGKDSDEAVLPIDDITVAKITFFGNVYFIECEKYIKQDEVKCSSKRTDKK